MTRIFAPLATILYSVDDLEDSIRDKAISFIEHLQDELDAVGFIFSPTTLGLLENFERLVDDEYNEDEEEDDEWEDEELETEEEV